MLDVRRLTVLREVALQGSFSAAAQALSLTQSAVSQQIAAFERETGTLLVERRPRGMRLTEAGAALVRHSEDIIARIVEAERELEAIAGLTGGRLRLAAFESAGAALMPPAIAEFRRRHPQVELSLALADPDASLPRLRAGELEVALVEGGTVQVAIPGDVELVHLLEDPMVMLLPAEHPLANAPELRLEDFADDAWIQGGARCVPNVLVAEACAAAGFTRRVAFVSDDYSAVQGLVAAGVGVAVIAELGTTALRPDIVARTLGDQIAPRQVLAATGRGAHRSAATAAMVQVLREVADRHMQGASGPVAVGA